MFTFKRKKIATVVSSSLGNALEFYDFTLCGVFIPILSLVFFSSGNETTALMGSLFSFSAAFWTRPLGAFLFGYIGDKLGRKKALSLTVILMGIPTTTIGFLPSFETIGFIAPVLLILLRMLQGLCTGGEYNGAAVFAIEHGAFKPGTTSGIIGGSCVSGAVLATIVGYWVTKFPIELGYWRIPFLFGGVISLIGFYIRKRTSETDVFEREVAITNQNKTPIVEIIKNYPIPFVVAIFCGAFNGAITYTLFGFLNVYIIKYVGFDLASGIFSNIFGMLAFMISCFIFGMLYDHVSKLTSQIIPCILASTFAVVAFNLFQAGSLQSVIIGQILLGTAVGSFVGPSHAYLQTLFNPEVRYTGVALGFCIGMAATGGSTAMFLVYGLEATKNLFFPVYYIIGASIVWATVSTIYERSITGHQLQFKTN